MRSNAATGGRDPRVDPKAGDRLRHHGSNRFWTVTEADGALVKFHTGERRRMYGIGAFRDWAKRAEVVHAEVN